MDNSKVPFIKVVLAMLIVLLVAAYSSAHDKVVVIPLKFKKNIENVITVAKSGGDFKDPAAAMASITDASSDNKYVIFVGPGEYILTQPLQIKSYVHLIGSGDNLTYLSGEISSGSRDTSSSLVELNYYSKISDLNITNNGDSQYSIGVRLVASSEVDNINISVGGGYTRIGLLVDSLIGSAATIPIKNVSIIINLGTGDRGYGVYLDNSISSTPAKMQNIDVYVGGGDYAYGAFITGSSIAYFFDSRLEAQFSDRNSNGLRNVFSSTTLLRNCTLRGGTAGLYASTGTVRVNRSSIRGGASAPGSATITCTNSDNGVSTELDASCQ